MEKKCEVNQKPKTVREFFTSWYFYKPLIAVIVGGLGGFVYYHFVGCASGSCPITSNPYMSIIMGAFLGFFVVNSPCSSGKC